ncbi:hypothetical protein OGAPHI_000468 [Ogataea philodendri]|uniref:ABC transporter domain-containing protein n=1 Tax=Ogataea philodendri TaxID=1378263 RepID=A0A9P8PGR0_9ASCO|nr:uncharacterized protein OGAPHI_000468 [Ogataea philodendri]KAH3671245.1 hypothetical protein OGAPHI_000468 [Ogataea philodendri]
MKSLEFVSSSLPESSETELENLSFTRTHPVSINVEKLCISARKRGKSLFGSKKVDPELANENVKQILHPVTFSIPENSLACIIGGSGSGKTTLLNRLAEKHFMGSTLVQSGTVTYNGEPTLSKIRHAYVIQQDILIPTLTCFETLMFAAELKLPKLTSRSARAQLVDEIILELGLKECRNTLVGDRVNKGLSGGEKRRLSVGIQLVSNPSILFLDEPTTGLDSYNAYLLCESLKRLTKRLNKTIILSIHQPRADIFRLFDQVFILSKGRMCYGDTYSRMFDHFASLGYPIPETVNPADFLIDLTSVDTRSPKQEEESLQRVTKIAHNWELHMHSLTLPSYESKTVSQSDDMFQQVGKAPFFRELRILVRRNLILERRNPLGYAALLLEAVVLGLMTGWLYFKPGSTIVGIRSIEASLYTVSSLQAYLFLLYESYRLCSLDLRIYDREHSENCVSVAGFVLSRRIAKLFTEDLIIPLVYSLCTYFMLGLRTDSAIYFFRYFAASIMFHLNSMAFAMVASALSRDVAIATLICNLNFTFQTMTNGMYVNAKQMPVYVRWCKYIAYQWYSFGLLVSNEFTGFKGDCFKQYAGNPDVDSICEAFSGKYITRTLGFWENWIALPFGVLIAFFLGTFVVAGLILKLKPVDISMAREVKSGDSSEKLSHSEPVIVESNTDPLDITLTDINLAVTNKMARETNKTILNGVSCRFKSGKLNIIMGPSGCGKTSLLNLISGRLKSNLFTKYAYSGSIYLNDCLTDFDTIKPICSYVVQEDSHLLPSITVRETLLFSARMRLSKSNFSRSQINGLVDQLILRVGLRDCANTLVGNDLIKGISGGEKRRLSIAIQLLSSPKMLVLDEPTSGLDAFTASSILECLEQLANSGTTVVMTIHQPRSLDGFGSILLLAKGGWVTFNGTQQELLQHFTNIGYPVPKFTNAADHIIDTISYSTTNEKIEHETRKRVDYIVQSWSSPDYSIVTRRTLSSKADLQSEFHAFVKQPVNFMVGLYVNTARQMLTLVRDKNVLIARCTQVIGMGLILSLFFARLKHNNTSVQNRLGLIQQIVSLYFTGMLNNMAAYPRERDFFYEEYSDDATNLYAFFASYTLIEIPFEILNALVFSVLLMFVVGFQYDVGLFFAMVYTSGLVVNAGESVGLSFNTVFDHPGFALNVISIICSVGVAMAGLLAMTLDDFLSALNYLSPAHYCVMTVSNLVFTDKLKLYCTKDELVNNGQCLFNTGKDVMDSYNLKVHLKLYLVLIAVVTVCHRLIPLALLRIKLVKTSLIRLVHSSS